MSNIEAKGTCNNDIEEKQKSNYIFKKLFQSKKILIGLIVLVLISPVIYGFTTGVIRIIQIRKAPQGELIFYVMHDKDIQDPKLKKWVEENHKTKGIHVFRKNRASDEKYVLLSTGEQTIQDIKIIMESVVGYKDKILINGRVTPPKSNIVKKKSYPHQLIRIETKNDPRTVQLGTMNLYDVFRGIQEPIRISLDNAIVKEVNGDTIKLATFKQRVNHPLYILTEKALKEFKDQNIVAGDLVGININNDLSKGYPRIENIRKTTRVIEKVTITKVSEGDKVVTVEINKIPFMFKYRGEIQDKINKVIWNKTYLVKLEKVGDVIYIIDIIG